MGKIADSIARIRQVARIAKEIDSSLDELHGVSRDLGIDYFNGNWRTRARDANLAALTLETFLAGLGVEDLRRIEALMYSGRGDGSASDLRQQLAENRSSKEEVVRTIMEKRVSFDPYFDRGLDRAKADGIDLDTF